MLNTTQKLPRSFYERDTIVVARDLIGHIIVHVIGNGLLAGIIVETEAYRGDDDPACHAYRGKTQRNAPMFGQVGLAYIYFVYGNHFCFNIVAKAAEQKAGAVLIRAIEPLVGIDRMRFLRGINNEKTIANGPGKLTQALQITKKHNFVDCTRSQELFVIKGNNAFSITQTPRIGISQAKDKLWRFMGRGDQGVAF